MKFRYFLFFSIIFNNYFCYGQENCNELSKLLYNNSVYRNEYYEIHSMGKKAIPCLITLIDTNKKSSVGFLNPYSSFIPSFILKDNFIGIKAAYLIEFILSKDSVKNVKVNLYKREANPYQIFRFGVIVKNEKKTDNEDEPLQYEDMKIIKEIYMQWWVVNKDKSLQVLRKEWKNNERPLNGSNYQWR